MKKFASLLLALCMILGMVSFANAEGVANTEIKIGFICIGDENEGYTANHVNALRTALTTLGIDEATQVIYKWNIPESEKAYEAAIDLAEQECDIIFANSFRREAHVFLAASEYPEIEFCHATGTQASSTGLTNTHNHFTAVFEGRYASGVVAGLKLNQMIADGVITADAAKIGYVGAFPFEEVKSGYTAFFLGARSVCPTATMEVKFTNSWGDFAKEKAAAEALISNKCVLISQHADTTGAPTACQENGVPCVGYNISMINAAPDCALISPACNWGAYYTYALENVIAGTEFPADWCKGFSEGAVFLTELYEAVAAPGTAEALAQVVDGLKAGTVKVFDVSTFTVGGETLTSAFALDTDGDWVPDTHEAIIDGAFAESFYRSAPYFGLDIDGITMVD